MSKIIGGVKINRGVGKLCRNLINGGVKIIGGTGIPAFIEITGKTARGAFKVWYRPRHETERITLVL